MKLIKSVFFVSVLLLSGCATSESGKADRYELCLSVSAAEECQQYKIVSACTELVNKYPYVRDRLLYEQYGALFTEDARFQIQGMDEVVGRDAIVQALRIRGPQRTTRHFNEVVNMQVLDSSKAIGISYVKVWGNIPTPELIPDQMPGLEPEKTPVNTIGTPIVIGEYHDEFVINNGRCLISKRVVKIIFTASQ